MSAVSVSYGWAATTPWEWCDKRSNPSITPAIPIFTLTIMPHTSTTQEDSAAHVICKYGKVDVLMKDEPKEMRVYYAGGKHHPSQLSWTNSESLPDCQYSCTIEGYLTHRGMSKSHYA